MMQVSGIFQAIFERQIFRFVVFWFGWFFLDRILFGSKLSKAKGHNYIRLEFLSDKNDLKSTAQDI